MKNILRDLGTKELMALGFGLGGTLLMFDNYHTSFGITNFEYVKRFIDKEWHHLFISIALVSIFIFLTKLDLKGFDLFFGIGFIALLIYLFAAWFPIIDLIWRGAISTGVIGYISYLLLNLITGEK